MDSAANLASFHHCHVGAAKIFVAAWQPGQILGQYPLTQAITAVIIWRRIFHSRWFSIYCKGNVRVNASKLATKKAFLVLYYVVIPTQEESG